MDLVRLLQLWMFDWFTIICLSLVSSSLIGMMVHDGSICWLNLCVPEWILRSSGSNEWSFLGPHGIRSPDKPTGLLHRWDRLQMENLRRVSSTVVATVVTWLRRGVVLGLI